MNKIRSLDINCDVGEGVGNEQDLMPLIDSCSVACGGHAGDLVSMRSVIRLAKQYKVRIGAHPSYPDKKNFGRLSMKISAEELTMSIQSQLANFVTIAREEKAKLYHIKPHGALYNDLAKDDILADIFLEAIKKYQDSVLLYVPFKSVIERQAVTAGFHVKREAFADRNYANDLSLVPRTHAKAVITNPKEVLAHLLHMVKNNKVRTVDNSEIYLKAETFCLHGDTPNALEILMYIRRNLSISPNSNQN